MVGGQRPMKIALVASFWNTKMYSDTNIKTTTSTKMIISDTLNL